MQRRHFLMFGLSGLAALPVSRVQAREPRSVFLEELTWTELRAAVGAGYTVALLPTGGTEQNGPHMALGKHNVIVRHTAGEIARRLGNAVVAPVVAYVPEGRLDPPSGHMAFPGTIGVSDATFSALLQDAATSLAAAGFSLICFLGDHGGSQPAQEKVAARLSRAWRPRGVHVANLGRYYGASGQEAWLKAQGFDEAAIGRHAGLLDTAELAALAPNDVRNALLSPKTWPAGVSGVAGDPSRATPEIGSVLLELKIMAGVTEAREILATLKGTTK